MPPTTQQKAAIAELIGITKCDKTTALKLMKQHNFNVNAAVNAYYGQSTASNTQASAPLNKIFDKYRDDVSNAPDEIGVMGTGNLLSDIDVEIQDVGALIFSELVQSPSFGSITREGFIDGCSAHGVDTLAKLKNLVLQRRAQLPTDISLFRNVYNHTFAIGLQERQKSLSADVALDFWRLLFTAPSYQWQTANAPWLEWWCEFHETKINKAINKDLWKQTLSFALETMRDETLGFWTEESSWPSVIDEFVGWARQEKMGGGQDPDPMNVD